MILSDQQMAVVRHGSPDSPTYEWVELPVGPQPIPAWARGLEINWMDPYCNPPEMTVKAPVGFRSDHWENKRYRVEGQRYLAESGDGRASCFYHSGELRIEPLPHRHRFLVVLPSPPPRNKHGYVLPDHWRPLYYRDVEYPCWTTFKDHGFGGDNIGIHLEDGRRAVLRGPWHGPSPEGYIDCAVKTGHGWKCSLVGCLISEALLLLLIAKHHAHLRVARVTHHGRSRIEPVREDWDEPKAWMDAKRRGR